MAINYRGSARTTELNNLAAQICIYLLIKKGKKYKNSTESFLDKLSQKQQIQIQSKSTKNLHFLQTDGQLSHTNDNRGASIILSIVFLVVQQI